jgi:membrane-bound metal-dependent hydrolase YbcI (DUF457 family)
MTFTAVGGAIWLFLAGLALRYGGRPERIATGALLVGWLITLSSHEVVDPLTRASVSPVIVATDSVTMLLFVVLARDLSRPWMAAAAACLAAVVMIQLISLFNPEVLTIGYLVAQSAASYGIMACLVYGALRLRARQAAR